MLRRCPKTSTSGLAGRCVSPLFVLVVSLVTPALDAQDERFRVRIQAPATELTTGSEFNSAVLLDAPVPGVQGWSFGVSHDPAALELLQVERGETAAPAENGGFLVLDDEVFNGTGFTLAVVLSFTQPVSLPAGNDQVFATMRYRVVADPGSIDPCEPVVTSIRFDDTLANTEGGTSVSLVITVQGQSAQNVVRVDGPITVRCPGTIEFTRCEGETDSVTLEWIFGGPPEWDFLFLYRDAEFLAMLEIDQTSYFDQPVEAGEHDYTILTVVVNDPSAPTLLFAHCRATVIPIAIDAIDPAIGDWIGGETVTLTGTGFTSFPITALEFFAEGEDPLPLEVSELTSDTELTAITPQSPRLGTYSLRIVNERGSAELADAFDYGFIRGEMNSEAPTDISDAVYLLGYLFLGTEPIPRCQDSADFTDDGMLDISDAILLLNFLFLGGPPPKPPFPEPGTDPTPDSLGCLE